MGGWKDREKWNQYTFVEDTSRMYKNILKQDVFMKHWLCPRWQQRNKTKVLPHGMHIRNSYHPSSKVTSKVQVLVKSLKLESNSKVRGTRSEIMASKHLVDIAYVNSFINSRSKSQDQISWYQIKGLIKNL